MSSTGASANGQRYVPADRAGEFDRFVGVFRDAMGDGAHNITEGQLIPAFLGRNQPTDPAYIRELVAEFGSHGATPEALDDVPAPPAGEPVGEAAAGPGSSRWKKWSRPPTETADSLDAAVAPPDHWARLSGGLFMTAVGAWLTKAGGERALDAADQRAWTATADLAQLGGRLASTAARALPDAVEVPLRLGAQVAATVAAEHPQGLALGVATMGVAMGLSGATQAASSAAALVARGFKCGGDNVADAVARAKGPRA
jgi:hypothetical protein